MTGSGAAQRSIEARVLDETDDYGAEALTQW